MTWPVPLTQHIIGEPLLSPLDSWMYREQVALLDRLQCFDEDEATAAIIREGLGVSDARPVVRAWLRRELAKQREAA